MSFSGVSFRLFLTIVVIGSAVCGFAWSVQNDWAVVVGVAKFFGVPAALCLLFCVVGGIWEWE